MKKIVYILMLIFECAALSGAYIIHYFTKRKLGMVRYLNYKNMVWERDYPVDTIKTICVVLVAAVSVFVLFHFLKRRKEISLFTGVMNGLMIVLTMLYGGYTLTSTIDTMADYYFISILFLLAVVIQIVITGISLFTTKEQKVGN